MSRTIASGLAVLALTGMGVVTVAAPASATEQPCPVTGSGGHYPPGLCMSSSVTQSTQTPTAANGAGSSSSSNLPFTGAATAAEGAAGLGLLAAGTLAVVLGRRRRTASVK